MALDPRFHGYSAVHGQPIRTVSVRMRGQIPNVRRRIHEEVRRRVIDAEFPRHLIWNGIFGLRVTRQELSTLHQIIARQLNTKAETRT